MHAQIKKVQSHMYIQSNFVKMKSSGLSVLFRIISSSSYREVDIKKYTPLKKTKKMIINK